MVWSQALCAGTMLLLGLAVLAYSARAFAGQVRTPWSYLLPRRPVPPEEGRAQDQVISALLALIFGSIMLLGGLGLVMVLLI